MMKILKNTLLLIFSTILFLLPQQGYGQVVFGPEQLINPKGTGVRDVIAADLDGDGDMDMLSASSKSLDNRIAWYANDGLGGFGTQQIITTDGGRVVAIYAADIDNDGDVDVLSVSNNDNKIVWYANDGDGNFGELQIVTANIDGGQDVYAIDLDNDGDVDVLSASSNDNKIAWYANDGFGNFGEQQNLSTNALAANAVYAIDLDSDGDIDVLSASSNDNKIAWYENNGLGNFSEEQIITTSAGGAWDVSAADVDNDGDLDVLSAARNDNKIAWYENNGLAEFGEEQIVTTAANGINSFFVIDLDSDGDIDVLSALEFADKITWYANDGQGNFGEEQVITTIAQEARAVYAADLNNDGDLEVLSGSFHDNIIAWYLNEGEGNFGEQQIVLASLNGVSDMSEIDIDNDGDMDILSSSSRDDKIAWYENDGQGVFEQQHIISTEAEGILSVYTIDRDNDGDMDILAGLSTEIIWYINDGLGNFNEQFAIVNIDDARVLLMEDLDDDGDLDLLVGAGTGNIDSGYDMFHKKIVWYANDGLGNFFLQQTIAEEEYMTLLYLSRKISLSIMDIDNDGDLDILEGDPNGRKIVWYANNGLGNFVEQEAIVTSGKQNSVYKVDIDDDGDMDILAAAGIVQTEWFYDSDNVMVAWYENDGTGNFETQNIIDDVEAFFAVAADVDNDEDIDVLAATRNGVGWYINDGLGNFGEQQIIALNNNVNLSVIDIDNDNDQDVLFFGGGTTIACYENLLINPYKIYTTPFVDLNQNGIFDTDEYRIYNSNIQLSPEAITSITNAEGRITSYVDIAEYEIHFPTPTNWMATTLTAQTVAINEENPIAEIYFGIYSSELTIDANISLTSAPIRCNREVSFWLNYTNTGTTLLNGLVELNIDSLTEYLSANMPPDSLQNQTRYWKIDSLLPFQTQTIKVTLQMPTADFIDQELNFNATIYEYDETVNDYRVLHSDYWNSSLLCSYDPNDKLVQPTGIWDNNFTLLTDTLDYTIRFQNTGNDTAFHVRITDQLSADLDLETFKVIANSHTVETSFRSDGLLEFNFPKILLPDSTTNEPESHGFIRYEILAKQYVSNAMVVNNTANIYFDLNPPIVTNNTHNTMVEELPVPPTVIAANAYICNGSSHVLLHAEIGDGINPQWTTIGDGTFENLYTSSTTYHLGETDLTQDTLQLVISAVSPIGYGGYAYDTLQIPLGQGPNNCDCSNSTIDINALQYNIHLLNNSPIVFNVSGYQTATVAIWGGTAPYNLEWETEGYVRHIITEQLVDTDEDGIPDTPGALVTLLYADNASWELVRTNQNHCIGELFAINSNVFEQGNTINIVNSYITPDTGGNIGSIELTLANNVIGCLPYNYELYNVDSLLVASGTTSNNLVINNLASGWYTCYVYCDSTDPNTASTVGWYWVEPVRRGRAKLGESNLQIHPNPFSDISTITYQLPSGGKTKIQLFSIDGQLIKTLFDGAVEANQPNQISLKGEGLSNGLYLVKMQTSTGEVYTQKLVLAREEPKPKP